MNNTIKTLPNENFIVNKYQFDNMQILQDSVTPDQTQQVKNHYEMLVGGRWTSAGEHKSLEACAEWWSTRKFHTNKIEGFRHGY